MKWLIAFALLAPPAFAKFGEEVRHTFQCGPQSPADCIPARLNPGLKNFKQAVGVMRYNYQFLCALDDQGVRCWDSELMQRDIGVIKDVWKIGVRNFRICAWGSEGRTCLDPYIGLVSRDQTHADLRDVAMTEAGECNLVGDKVFCNGSWKFTEVEGLTGVSEIAGGYGHICVRQKKQIRCFMTPEWYQQTNYNQTAVPPLVDPSSLEAEAYATCVQDQGKRVCWGSGYKPELKHVRSYSESDTMGCAIDDLGLRCWGYSADYEHFNALQPPPIENPTQVAVGHGFACAISAKGMDCWGQKYILHTIEYELPRHVDMRWPVKIVASKWNVCVLHEFRVSCWGSDIDGTTRVPPLKKPAALYMNNGVVCARDEGQTVCWGNAQPPSFNGLKKRVDGKMISCAIDEDGTRCWGKNGFNQWLVPLMKNATDVAVTETAACFVVDGVAKCWSEEGDPRRTKVTVISEDAVQLAATDNMVCAVNAQRKVRCMVGGNLVDPEVTGTLYLLGATKDGVCFLQDSGLRCAKPSGAGLVYSTHESGQVADHDYLNLGWQLSQMPTYTYRHDTAFLKSLLPLLIEGQSLTGKVNNWIQLYLNELADAYTNSLQYEKSQMVSPKPESPKERDVARKILIEAIKTSQTLLTLRQREVAREVIGDLSRGMGQPLTAAVQDKTRKFLEGTSTNPYLATRLPLELWLVDALGAK